MTKKKRNLFAILIVAATALFSIGFAKQNVKAAAEVEGDGFSATLSTVKYNVSKTDGAYTLLAATLNTENLNRIYEVGFKAYNGEEEISIDTVDAANKKKYYTSINGATSETIFGTTGELPMIVWKIVTPTADVSYEAYVKYGFFNESDNNNLWSYAPERTTISESKTAVTVYQVTIDEDGGNEVADISVPAGTAASALNALTVTKTGYHYDAWQVYVDGVWVDLAETEKVTANVTVRPKWVANMYSVVFKNDDGSVISNESLAYGTAITAPTPTKEGYDLSWDKEVPATVTDDVTITAIWTARTDMPYTVNHYKKNVAGDGWLDPEVENKTGTTDTLTAAEAKSYDLYVASAFEQATIAGDGTTEIDIYYEKKELGATSIRYTRTGDNFVAEWDEVQYADGYEVLVDGVAFGDYTSGTQATIPATACKTLSVKATNAEVGTEGATATKFLDVSYLTAKGASYTYLSNFNNAGTEAMWSQDAYRTGAWFSDEATYTYQNANGVLTIQGGQSATGYYIGVTPSEPGKNGTLQGVKFTKQDGYQAAAIYTLPEAFDLAGKGKLFVKTWQGVWGSQLNPYIMLVNGSKRLNVMGDVLYAENSNYNNEEAATNTISPGNYATTFAATNFYANMFVIDLEALIATSAWSDVFGTETSIKSIVIGISGAANRYYYLDEIYFGNLPTLSEKYAFSATSGVPSGTSWSNNGTGTATIVADEKATDGYALKITHNQTYNYFIELSETVNLDEYSSIVIRYKTTSASTYLYACDEKTGGNFIDVNSLAGSSVATGADGDYVEVDILSALKAKTDTLKWVKTWCNDASGGDIYIDSITFTKNPA